MKFSGGAVMKYWDQFLELKTKNPKMFYWISVVGAAIIGHIV